MTNKKTLRRVVVLVLSLLLCSMSFLCVTLAKYQSNFTGSGTGTVATWEFAVNGTTLGETVTEFAEIEITSDDVKFAPGASNKVALEVINVGSVDAVFGVEVNGEYDAPNAFSVEISVPDDGEIAAGATATVILSWNWEFTEDIEDDMLWYSTAEEAKTITIPLAITFTQAAPAQD